MYTWTSEGGVRTKTAAKTGGRHGTRLCLQRAGALQIEPASDTYHRNEFV